MKKILPALAVVGSIAALAYYKLKKDENDKIDELEKELLASDLADENGEDLSSFEGNLNQTIIEKANEVVSEKVKADLEQAAGTEFDNVDEEEEQNVNFNRVKATKDAEDAFTQTDLDDASEEDNSLSNDNELNEEEMSAYENIKEAVGEKIKEISSEKDLEEENENIADEPVTETDEETSVDNESEVDDIVLEDEAVQEKEEDKEEISTRLKEDDIYPCLNQIILDNIEIKKVDTMADLNEKGDINTNERPIQHFVTFDKMQDLESFKNKVINRGFVITKGENSLDLIVLHISSLVPEKINKSIMFLANEAYANKGLYTGWKSKVSL